MEIGCVVLGGFRHFSWGNESDGGVGGRVVVRGGKAPPCACLSMRKILCHPFCVKTPTWSLVLLGASNYNVLYILLF